MVEESESQDDSGVLVSGSMAVGPTPYCESSSFIISVSLVTPRMEWE